MKKLLAQLDWGIFLSVILLLVLGLMVIGSVAPQLFLSQLAYALLGMVFFLFLAHLDYRLFLPVGQLFYFFSLIALILTFFLGTVTRGSVRWLQFGRLALQPSELVKPFLILAFASFFSSRPISNFRSLLTKLSLLALPAFLIFIQPDLGSSLVVIFLGAMILVGAGIPRRLLLFGGWLTVILLPLGWFSLQPYQKARIFAFLNPFSDPLGTGYNLLQAMVAVGSGRIWGRGLGRGTQSHLRFLPEHHTDFIFASLAEELGFLGAAFLILVYAFLLARLLNLAQRSQDRFASLICLGVFGMLFSQFFVNVGMNLGLVPIAGITLPLVSYGGSSLVATLISLGIVENIARSKYNLRP